MEEVASALAIAQYLELSILMAQGIQKTCGCTKFVMCRMPESGWYYTTLCPHDLRSRLGVNETHGHWWYDFSEGAMVSREDFNKAYALLERDGGWYVSTRVGDSLFEINRNGRVRRRYPLPITEWK